MISQRDLSSQHIEKSQLTQVFRRQYVHILNKDKSPNFRYREIDSNLGLLFRELLALTCDGSSTQGISVARLQCSYSLNMAFLRWHSMVL
jgi:hypothetical protein